MNGSHHVADPAVPVCAVASRNAQTLLAATASVLAAAATKNPANLLKNAVNCLDVASTCE
jgi:hypothetical protein